MILDDKDPAESVVVEFDFSGEITLVETYLVSVTPVNGIDPDTAAMLDGTVQIAGSSVYQRVKLGIAGINYKLRCEASQGDDIRVLAGVLPVRAA